MALFRKTAEPPKQEQKQGPLPPGTQPTAKPQDQPVRDTTHGHPGLPPKDYRAPKE